MQTKTLTISAALIAALTSQAIGIELAEPTMSIIVNNSSGGSSNGLESGVVDVGDDGKGSTTVETAPPPGLGPGSGPGPVDESEDESEDESPDTTTPEDDEFVCNPGAEYDNYDEDSKECLCTYMEYC